MTKKEIKNMFTRKALTVLEDNFNVLVGEGGRTIKFEVEVNGNSEGGCIGRDDLMVTLNNTIGLFREQDFPAEYVAQHKACVALENEMNEFLEPLQKAYYEARNFS